MTGGLTVPVRVNIVDLAVVRFGASGIETLLMRRAEGARCTGAWELVHGKINAGEAPEAAAIRELREETGFTCERLYNITLGGFYLHMHGVLSLTVVFCAVVASSAPDPVLGEEHDRFVWLPPDDATRQVAWPREREALQHIAHLLRNGHDAGAVEDVLRVM